MYINKLGSRSYDYIHLKNSHICVIHLVLERCYFETILPKRSLLGIKGENEPLEYIIFSFTLNKRSIYLKCILVPSNEATVYN